MKKKDISFYQPGVYQQIVDIYVDKPRLMIVYDAMSSLFNQYGSFSRSIMELLA